MFLLTVDLCDTSATLHSDSDVNASKALLTQQQHWLQKLQGQNKAHSSTNVIAALNPNDGFFFILELTLYWRVAGSSISRGLPLTFKRPFPLLQWATAVAVFYDNSNS